MIQIHGLSTINLISIWGKSQELEGICFRSRLHVESFPERTWASAASEKRGVHTRLMPVYELNSQISLNSHIKFQTTWMYRAYVNISVFSLFKQSWLLGKLWRSSNWGTLMHFNDSDECLVCDFFPARWVIWWWQGSSHL